MNIASTRYERQTVTINPQPNIHSNKKVQTAMAYTFNYIIPSTHIIASAWSQHKPRQMPKVP